MALRLLADGNEYLAAPSVQERDEDIDLRKGLPLHFGELCGALYRGDPKEFIKHAMLQQEAIFHHQVLELHRLYWVQKNIVEDFYGGNRFHIISNGNANALPKETEEKTRFVWQRCVGSSEHQLGHYMFYNGQQRNFSLLQPLEGFSKLSSSKCLATNRSIHNGVVIDLESMDPNHSAGENNNEMNIPGRYIPYKRYHSNIQNLFDLNETIFSMSNEEGVSVSSSTKTPFLSCNMYESQLPVLSDVDSCGRTIKDTGELPAKLPTAGQDMVCEIQLNTQSDTINRSSSQRACQFDFDLNKVQLSESHAALDEPQHIASSASGGSSANSNGSTDESHFSTHSFPTCLKESKVDKADVLKDDIVSVDGKESNNHCKDLCHQNMQDFPETNRLSTGACNDGRYDSAQYCSIGLLESQRCCHELSSDSRVTERSSEVFSSILTSNFCKKYKDTYPSLKPPILDTGVVHSDTDKKNIILSHPSPEDLLGKMEKDERSQEDALSSGTHGDGMVDKDDASAPCEELFSDRGKLRLITRNDLCSMTCHDLTCENDKCKQMIQVIDVCDTFDVHKNHANLVMDKHEETQKALEMDPMVLLAAESLVNILVKDSSKRSQVGQTKLKDDITMHEQPQCSSSSLESIVLAMKEIEMDECSSPIFPAEKETVKDDVCRFKTRSGRRLRDFQKDILPGIVSLSRHEICEDFHAFNEIVKSNDLKNGIIKPFKGSWSSKVRNRRSRFHSRKQRQ